MGFIKVLTFVLALASVATAAPVAPSRNQTDLVPSAPEAAAPSNPVNSVRPSDPVSSITPSDPVSSITPSDPVSGITPSDPVNGITPNVASIGDNKNLMVDFTVFDFTEEELSTAEIDQSESDDAQPSSNNRLHAAVAADPAAEGRPGKIPYKRFPPCYIKCFDSEGIDSKTDSAIGDIPNIMLRHLFLKYNNPRVLREYHAEVFDAGTAPQEFSHRPNTEGEE
ncbi:hypothetical protein E8E14_002163 [Neopestalotiopsis sp. 37M]|nr:hypothetical protein E8E14_002163 [Neopestalotiopsis sp. 37M]